MAEDRRGITIRLSVLQYAVIAIFTVLAVGFWVMQVVEHAKFEEMAENNHQRTLALRAPRGIVFDRDLKVLSSDGDSRTLQVMNNRIEFWTNDLGQRLDSVAGPISYTVTVSYAGTPSDPADDYWLSVLSDIRVRGDWSLDDTFCHVMVANLT